MGPGSSWWSVSTERGKPQASASWPTGINTMAGRFFWPRGIRFGAAAVEQLDIWRERAGVEIVKGAEGADPSAVIYDAAEAALARGVDVLIADTAGRLHTRRNLMDELKKVRRTVGRVIEGAPHEVLLVLDATTGQNAIPQAREFIEGVGVTGLILTKLDGTSKGGIVISIAEELGISVRYVGLGEGIEDLQPFDPEVLHPGAV